MAKKTRRNLGGDDELNITSMMDMMTIILVFLLKSFSATEITVTPSENLKLPASNSDKDPGVAVNVVIAKNLILVDDKKVLEVEPIDDSRSPGQSTYQIPTSEKKGSDIPKLYSAFESAASKAESIANKAKDRDDLAFQGKVLFQIDKDIPFSLVRDVMYNAGIAKFSEFEFVVIKSGE
jgi:biopolymer transport protein ExbD